MVNILSYILGSFKIHLWNMCVLITHKCSLLTFGWAAKGAACWRVWVSVHHLVSFAESVFMLHISHLKM